MKRVRWSRFIIFAMTSFLVLVSLLFFISVNPTLRQQASSLPLAVTNKLGLLFRVPYQAVTNFSDQLQDLVATYQENQRLKARLLELENQDSLIEQLEKDNENLRTSLGIKEQFSTGRTIPTQVLVRSSVAWLEQVTLDQGRAAGVDETMLLVSDKGLLGSIIQLDDGSSQVELLTNTVSHQNIPLKITAGKETIYGILTGFDPVRGAVSVSQLNSQADIPEGSYVATSGLDGKSLADIPVGQVLAVERATDQSRVVWVKLSADFSKLGQLSFVGRP